MAPYRNSQSQPSFWLIALVGSIAVHTLPVAIFWVFSQRWQAVSETQENFIEIELSEETESDTTQEALTQESSAESSHEDLVVASPPATDEFPVFPNLRFPDLPTSPLPPRRLTRRTPLPSFFLSSSQRVQPSSPSIPPPQLPNSGGNWSLPKQRVQPSSPSIPPLAQAPVSPIAEPLAVPSSPVPSAETIPEQPVSPPPPSSNNTLKGFVTLIGELSLTVDEHNPSFDQLAKPLQNNQIFSGLDSSLLAEINLDRQGIALNVVVVIDAKGKPEVSPNSTEVLQGKIEPEKANRLAQYILQSWIFEPTYKNGQPISQTYVIPVALYPLFN